MYEPPSTLTVSFMAAMPDSISRPLSLGRKTLVLDLDETLIHSRHVVPLTSRRPDFVVNVWTMKCERKDGAEISTILLSRR